MFRLIVVAMIALGAAQLNAQEPPRMDLPKLDGVDLNGASAPVPGTGSDPVKLYNSPAEAALAAFQAGFRAATGPGKNDERAVLMFLLALRRDPTLAKALYNLSVLCAREERWDDAIKFRNAFQSQPGVDPALIRLSNPEMERLQTLAKLASTPEGKIRRQYDIGLSALLTISDPVKGLDAANRLGSVDKTRWEAPAKAGIFEGQSKAFPESAKSLDEAATLAPPDHRSRLRLAAEEARREATFGDQLRTADALWTKQQYEAAAQTYDAAWKAIPERLDPGLRAASGFLMADNIDAAVDVLSRMQGSAPGEMNAKVTTMLHELAPISEKAKIADTQKPPVPAAQPVIDTAIRIRDLVGSLSSPELELVNKPEPALLPDTTILIGMPDGEITGGQSGMVFTSVSIFEMYNQDRIKAQQRLAEQQPQAGADVAGAQK